MTTVGRRSLFQAYDPVAGTIFPPSPACGSEYWRLVITDPGPNLDDRNGMHYLSSADVVIERLGDSTLAVQLGTDRILELNETAGRLLELLLAGKSDVEAMSIIASEYDAPADELRASVEATLASLLAEQVLESKAD